VGKSLGIGEGFPGVFRAEVNYILGKKAAFYKPFVENVEGWLVIRARAPRPYNPQNRSAAIDGQGWISNSGD
jgi:hypothetical protein